MGRVRPNALCRAGSAEHVMKHMGIRIKNRLSVNAWTVSDENRRDKLIHGVIFLLTSLFIFSFFLVAAQHSFNSEEHLYPPTGLQDLSDGSVLEQDLSLNAGSRLAGVSIQYDTYDRSNRADITVSLLQDGKIIQEWVHAASILDDQEYYQYYLNSAITIREGSTYTIRISEKYPDADEYAAPYISDSSQLEEDSDNPDPLEYIPLRINNETVEGVSLCCAPLIRHTSIARFSILFAVLCFILLICLSFMHVREEYIMTFLFIINILLWSAIVPVGDLPDEPNHFLRTFEITCGNLITPQKIDGVTSGDILPKQLENLWDPDAVVNWSDTRIYTFPNTALYSPFSYIPQAVFVKIARFLTNNVHALYYSARLGSCLLSSMMCLYALWIIPYGRRILFTILMFPITAEGLITLSPDAMTLAICFLLTALTLRAEQRRTALKRSEIFWLTLLCLLLSQYKLVYIPMIFMVYAIPNECFSSRFERIYIRILLPLMSIMCYLAWFRIASLYTENVGYIPGTESSAQIHYMLTHPAETYSVFIRTISQQTNNLIGQTFGYSLEWDLHNFEIVPYMLLLLIAYEILTDHELPLLRRRTVLLFFVVILLVTGMTFAGIYAQGTPLGDDVVIGLQGRYFLEILPLGAYLIISMLNLRRKRRGAFLQYSTRASYLYQILMVSSGMSLLKIINDNIWQFAV